MNSFEKICKKLNVSGYRGIIGKELDPEIIFDLVNCFLDFMKPETFAIGMDTRPTSVLYKEFIKSIVLSKGIKMYDFGILPTPSLLFGIKEMNIDAGIMITASHNPIEYNALKLVKKGGYFLDENDIEKFKNYLVDKEREVIQTGYYYSENLGKYEKTSDIVNKHIEKIKNFVDIEAIKKSNLKVACDFCNGTAIYSIPELLKTFNINFDSIFNDPGKAFEREPEPNINSMKHLSNFMKEKEYDVGFIYDPDGDRVAVMMKDGKIISEEFTLLLSYAQYLKKKKGDIVVNLSTSNIVKKFAEENNQKVYYAKVGEINVTKTMIENNIAFGGEGNGGVICFDISNSRDSLIATALILEALAYNKNFINDIYEKYKDFIMIKKKYSKENFNIERFERMIHLNFGEYITNVSKQDGIRFDLKDGFIHVRESNTEPVVRIIIEEKKDLIEELSSKIDYYFS